MRRAQAQPKYIQLHEKAVTHPSSVDRPHENGFLATAICHDSWVRLLWTHLWPSLIWLIPIHVGTCRHPARHMCQIC